MKGKISCTRRGCCVRGPVGRGVGSWGALGRGRNRDETEREALTAALHTKNMRGLVLKMCENWIPFGRKRLRVCLHPLLCIVLCFSPAAQSSAPRKPLATQRPPPLSTRSVGAGCRCRFPSFRAAKTRPLSHHHAAFRRFFFFLNSVRRARGSLSFSPPVDGTLISCFPISRLEARL